MPLFFLQDQNARSDQHDTKTISKEFRFKPAANHQPNPQCQQRDAKELISSAHKNTPRISLCGGCMVYASLSSSSLQAARMGVRIGMQV